MPSVRWLLIAVIAIYSTSWIKSTIAADVLNTLPVASNGWRPIVGTQVKPYLTIEQQKKKQTISLTSNDPDHKNKNEKNKAVSSQNNKGSSGNPVHINHHGSTGHQVLTHNKSKQPLGPVPKPSKTSGGKPAPRHPVLGKLHAHLAHGSNKRYKPSSSSLSYPSLRDEIMAPAPSSAIGSYAYFNQGPISIQNTQLGLNKPYNSPGQVDFSNHFAFSNMNSDVVLSQQPYNYQKHPSQNELQPNHFVFINQDDEFTRNLVPPPPVYKPQGERETLRIKEPQKIISQSSSVHNSHLGVPKQKDELGNVIVQLSPSYNQFSQQNIGPHNLDLEITKEKFKEYHTTLAPSSYKTPTETYTDSTKYTKTPLQGYEVTEDKDWAEQIPVFKAVYTNTKANEAMVKHYKNKYQVGLQDNNRFHFAQHSDNFRPSENVQLQYPQQDDSAQFLPTPYNPDSAFPTSPTQAEVSTIYSEISQLNKKNIYKMPSTPIYNIKEVATHFPIFEQKRPNTQLTIPIDHKDEQEYVTEVTTRKEIGNEDTESTILFTKPTPPTTYPTRGTTWTGQRRPSHRRRKPTRPSTTEFVELIDDDAQNVETERPTMKPHRRRRPIKYRTTEEPKEEELISTVEPTTRPTIIYKPRPTRVQPQPQTITEEVFVNKNHRHRLTYQDDNRTVKSNNKYEFEDNNENDHTEYTDHPVTEQFYNNHQYEKISETEQPIKLMTKRRRIKILPTTTTEMLPSTNLNVPENELDFTTITNDDHLSESITIKEIYNNENIYSAPATTSSLSSTTITPSTTTTASTTSTTTTEATTKSNRIRRPIKYDVQRPRFSVKDYRQRLNQYMSSSTTESTKQTSESATSPRIRYPNRFKVTSTNYNDENNEPTESTRQKFMPKESRRKHYTTESSSEVSSTEKHIRTMKPRLRNMVRYRSTTEPTSTTSTTQKISIKPNIFTNLKRPQHLSLRNRIYNKRNNTTTATTTTTELITEQTQTDDFISNTDKTEVGIPFEIAESKIDITTQLYDFSKEEEIASTSTTRPTEIVKTNDVSPEVVTPDEAEAFLQLQRISDLTSSAHKHYNTPGLFKSMSPTSRKVPSYFTIATEDPILPIEAFFPNLGQKSFDKQ